MVAVVVPLVKVMTPSSVPSVVGSYLTNSEVETLAVIDCEVLKLLLLMEMEKGASHLTLTVPSSMAEMTFTGSDAEVVLIITLPKSSASGVTTMEGVSK